MIYLKTAISMRKNSLLAATFAWVSCPVFLSSMLLLSSCSSSGRQDSSSATRDWTMSVSSDKSFLLDASTSQEINYLQVVNDDTMAFYNIPENSIRYFRISDGSEVGKTQLYEEGPHALRGVQGFCYVSPDTIWVYKSWENDLVRVNARGEIAETRHVKDGLSSPLYGVFPFPMTDTPILHWRSRLILQGMDGRTDEGQLPGCTLLYDLADSTATCANGYPSVYGDPDENAKNWGAFSFRQVPYTMSPEEELVLSYPASDSVRVFRLSTGQTRSFPACYSKKTAACKPMTSPSVQADTEQYLDQYLYAGIVYDKYRHFYYRLVLLPLEDYDLNDAKTQQKQLAVMILDESFRVVGEFELPKDRYKYRNVFVSREGLHINALSEDDDYLRFVTLVPEKYEK